jgi:hypothetical protein
MNKQLIEQRLLLARNHNQINEIVDMYALTILLDNHLENCLRDARVRVSKLESEKMNWEIYQLN